MLSDDVDAEVVTSQTATAPNTIDAQNTVPLTLSSEDISAIITGIGTVIAETRTLLLAEIAQLRSSLASQSMIAEARERQVQAMQRELEVLRGDAVAKSSRPLINSIIEAHDTLGKVADHYTTMADAAMGATPTLPVSELISRLKDGQADLEMALSSNGVTVFSENNTGSAFNGQRQRVIGYLPAPSAAQAGLVAECARPGFETDTGLVQKERVRVFRQDSSGGMGAANQEARHG